MVLGKRKKQTFLQENLRQLQPLTRFSPVNCRAFITCDLVLFREKKRKRENIPLRAKTQNIKDNWCSMRVWRGCGEPLKLEKDTNSDVYALERNWVMDQMEVFQKKKKKINLSLSFNENIMHSSWEFFFGLQFFSLLICYVLDVSEVSHDDVLAKEHNSPLIGTCYVFAWHHAHSVSLLSQCPYELDITLIGERNLRLRRYKRFVKLGHDLYLADSKSSYVVTALYTFRGNLSPSDWHLVILWKIRKKIRKL